MEFPKLDPSFLGDSQVAETVEHHIDAICALFLAEFM
jgi:hypothetical protein